MLPRLKPALDMLEELQPEPRRTIVKRKNVAESYPAILMVLGMAFGCGNPAYLTEGSKVGGSNTLG